MAVICEYRVILRYLHMLKLTSFPHDETNCESLGRQRAGLETIY